MRPQLAAALLLLSAHPAMAQDQRARLIGVTPPFWPEILRDAGIFGAVESRVVVGPDGSVQRAAIELLRATHPGLRISASSTLPRWRFAPAVRGGHPVADTLIVRYVVTREIDLPPMTDSLRTDGPVSLNDSTWSVLFAPERPLPDRLPDPPVTADSVAWAGVASLLEAIAARGLDSAIVTCLSISDRPGGSRFSAADSAAVNGHGVRVIGPGHCPPTRGGPANYPGMAEASRTDPIRLRVGRVMGWGRDSWWVELQSARSAAGSVYRCGVWRRSTDGALFGRCVPVEQWVS